ncbi:unnamed protein product [Auanema sp. JU1783]|nr:unnamed protein product [Auanema sp. JU1783]
MLPPVRRSERLKGKTVDYSVYFKNVTLKSYRNFYDSLYYWKEKRNSPHQRSTRRKPRQHDGNSTRRSRISTDTSPPINPIDRVKQTITKLTTKCKTKGLMSSILGKKFTCSTPFLVRSRDGSNTSPPSSSKNDDYFAHISPISPGQSCDLNVSVSDVMDISQQFAGMRKKTRRNLTSIAEEVKGRPLAEEELDELQTTIRDLDLSGFYSNNEMESRTRTPVRQIFVAKPIDLDSIGNTPRSSVFTFENNGLSPQSIRYARYVERQYIRRNTYNPDKPLSATRTSSSNTKTLKMLDTTYTNVKKMLRTRRSSDSYEEDSD